MHRAAGVLLDGDDIRLAAVLVRLGVAYLQRVNGTVPAAALALRDQLAAFARETSPPLASAMRETGKPAAAAIVADSGAQMMTVRMACELTGLSPQAVRGHCRTGKLLATRTPAGWQIDPATLASLARRKGTP